MKIKKLEYVQLGWNFRGDNKHTLNVCYTNQHNKEIVECLPISNKVYTVLEKKGFAIEG